MSKIIIWGTAGRAEQYYRLEYLHKNDEIVGVVDNNLRHKFFYGMEVLSPTCLNELSFDSIVVCSSAKKEITEQINSLLVKKKEIIFFDDILERFKWEIIEKYSHTNDPEISYFVNYLKDNNLTALGPYLGEHSLSEVMYDKDRDPYILFFGKKMFYPRDYDFYVINGKEYICDILSEQEKGSPHLYCYGEHDVSEGDVIVDAGVCEGNFSLKYADIAKKIYLIECEEQWRRPLEKTFYPYKEKVVFCNKMLGRTNSSSMVTLDRLIPDEKIDFLKMDIEGAEIDALLGAKNVLSRSSAKCSICSYHKENDVDNISFLMKNMGYKTSTSNGYMFFIWDNQIADSMDFRRGIVYAIKDYEEK